MLEKGLLNHNDTYIVGVSAGCDSMALLDMLVKENYKVIVAFVNYHLREDVDKDEEALYSYTHTHSITVHQYDVDTSIYEGNFQSQARDIRYTFYKQLCEMYHTDKVLLAHHLDDHLETIYMMLERHTHPDYMGIKERSEINGMTIIRPLLTSTKKELREYCHTNHVPYHDDYTNFETHYTRDRVRNTVLNTYTSSQKEELLKIAKTYNKEREIEKDIINKYMNIYHKQGYINYKDIDQKYLKSFLYSLISEHEIINGHFLDEVMKQMSSTKPSICMNIGHIQFIKEYDNIYIQLPDVIKSYEYTFYDITSFTCCYFTLSDTGPLNNGICLLEDDFPITIRNIRSGDRILTSGGTKKVSRLFIEKKVPKNQRFSIPILLNKEGNILLVPGIAKRKEYLYTKPNIFVIK